MQQRRTTLSTFALAAPLVLAACGGGSGNTTGVASLDDAGAHVETGGTDATSTTVAADGEVDTETQMLEFAQCMRDHGVDIADPVVDADGRVTFGGFGPGAGGPGDGDPAAGGPPDGFREAFDACGVLLDGVQFGPGRGSPGSDADIAQRQDQMLQFAQCMRDNGVDMPDPDFSNFGGQGQGQADGSGGRPRGPFADLDPSDPDVQAALDSCRDILGGFGPRGGPGPGDAPAPADSGAGT